MIVGIDPAFSNFFDSGLRLPQDIGIIRQFPFSSSRQCMSVVSRPITGDHFVVYCKGSPEKISQIARKETLPGNFAKLLEK